MSLFHRAKSHARKSIAHKIDSAVDGSLEHMPNVPFLTPVVDKIAMQAKKSTNKRLLKTVTDTDVLIIGAGISGILMATKLKKSRKLDRMMIVEKRQDIGGTWDVFNYPGIRSDSDISTFCFADRPWKGTDILARGQEIKEYLKEAVEQEDIKKHMHFGQFVKTLNWSSVDKFWTVTIEHVKTKKTEQITAKFIVGATGYYNTEQGYQPSFPNQQSFKGTIIHPQQWRTTTKYHDKKIVIIGSGATAVTLLPALLDDSLSQQAEHVTMLQRSPSYIISVSDSVNIVDKLSQDWNVVSTDNAYHINRWKNILTQQFAYKLIKQQPQLGKTVLKYATKKELKGSDVSLKHFTPTYNPWTQRVCAVPNGDFFNALKTGKADVVTDDIHKFTTNGIQLISGKHIPADIIVTATGLNIQMFGGATIIVDDTEVKIGECMTYKAVLLEGVPNMAVLFGYTNASWTLKSDVACSYVIRLLTYMDRQNYTTAIAKAKNKDDVINKDETVMDSLESGYVQRGAHLLPKQGNGYPWHVTNNYLSDCKVLLYKKINDKWLFFSD